MNINVIVQVKVNVQVVMTLREVGRGHPTLEMLCGFLDLPEPPYPTTASDIEKNIVDAYKNVASHSMISEANEIEGTKDEYVISLFHVMGLFLCMK